MFKLKLYWQILIAIVLAVVVGLLVQNYGTAWGIKDPALATFSFLGTVFINLLKMLIVPLIVSSMIVGVAGLGNVAGFARLGIKTVAWYATTSLLAILIGLTLVNTFQPGLGMPLAQDEATTQQVAQKLTATEGKDTSVIFDILLSSIPTNIVQSAAEAHMLSLIFFSLLFGFFMLKLPQNLYDPLHNFWKAVYELMLRMTDFVMLIAPLGVFGLVAREVANTGFASFGNVIQFFLVVLAGLSTHILIILPLLMFLIARVNPVRHYKAMAPALLTAFSTASSAATHPVTLDCVQRRAGVSTKTSSFVLPLGATINMDGTALYECVVVMFLAQAYGIEMTFAKQFLVVWLALITSVGVAGIPAASLIAIVIILNAVGLPPEGIGLVMVTDRLLDMCRTSVNIFSDSCGAVTIARTEGESNVLADPVTPQPAPLTESTKETANT